jgi:hypothetical protein
MEKSLFGEKKEYSDYLADEREYPPDMGVVYVSTRRGFPQFAVFIHSFPQVIHRNACS